MSGALKPGDSFPFYNEASGTIDSSKIREPINGNNGLTDNIIDYIFSKRESEIAYFLAWKMLKYYVKDKPTKAEIESFAQVILSNQFDIFKSLKTLLASDIMYSDEAMNTIYYKNPLELTIGTLKLLHHKNPSVIDPFIYDTNLLTSLEWTPYFPGSIFGRDGFDSNAKFFNSYIHNQWVNFSTKLAYYSSSSNYYNLDDLFPTKIVSESGSNINFSTFIGAKNLTGTLNLSNISAYFSGTVNFGSGDTNNINGFSGTIDLKDYILSIPSLQVSAKINSGVISVSNGNFTGSGISLTYSGVNYFVNSATATVDPSSSIQRDINIDEMISSFEDFLYLGRKLPEVVKTHIKNYLLTDENGNPRLFLPNDIDYKNKYIRGVVSIMLTQPEFVMNTGFDKSSQPNNSGNSILPNSSSKLVFVELFGGYDWLHAIVQKDNYDDYAAKRGSLAIPKSDMIDLGDYYMNPVYRPFKDLYDSNNLRIINRVGSTKHSRGHDTAAIQITSKNGLESVGTPSIIGNMIENEPDATKNIVLGTNSPNIYSNGNYLNIGGGDARYTNYSSVLTASGKISQLNTIRNIINSRNYPGDSSNLFKGSVIIDQVANTSVNAGGQPSSGYSFKQKLDFTKALIDNNLGTTYYIAGGHGYDTHSNQVTSSKTDYDLTDRTRDLANDLANFFNQVKNKDVTIVVFSEFGRTIKTNGTLGTDHGQGGGMFIISSNNSLLNSMPNKIIGNMNLAKEKFDWLGVGIDYRSVYNKILGSLYGIPNTYLGAKFNLEDDLSQEAPKIKSLNIEQKSNGSDVSNTISFDIYSKNFDIDKASNVKIKYGKDLNNLTNTINNYEIQYGSNPIVRGNKVKFTKSVSGTGFAYEIRITNNQFAETVLTGVIENTLNTGRLFLNPDKDTVIRDYTKTLSGQELILSGRNRIFLGATASGETTKILTKGNGIKLILGSGSTYIEKITGSGTWNGGFKLGEVLDKDLYLSDSGVTSSGEYIKDMKIDKLIKIGADTIGIGLKLDRNVDVEVDSLKPNTKYKIFYSEDNLNWNYMTGIISDSTGKGIFQTDHFTYFAFVDETAPVVVTPPVVTPPVVNPVNPPVVNGAPTPVYSGGGGGGGGLSRDYCPNGDYSPSYYDRTCGIKPSSSTKVTNMISTGVINTTEILKEEVLNQNNSFEKRYINYKGIKILDIKNYYLSQKFRKQAFNIIKSKKTIEVKKEFVNRLNSLLEAKFALDTDKTADKKVLQNKFLKRKILFNSYIKRKM